MGLREVVIGLGFSGLLGIAVTNIDFKDKVYDPTTTYYVGDNTTVIDQKSLISGMSTIPDGYHGLNAANNATWEDPSASDGIALQSDPNMTNTWSTSCYTLFANDSGKEWYDTLLEHYEGDSIDDLLKDKSPIFRFEPTITGKIYNPLDADCDVIDVKPNNNCGSIPNYEQYFGTGDGATITIRTKDKIKLSSDDAAAQEEQGYITLKLSYLEKTYASAQQTTEHAYYKISEKDNGKFLYYTNWNSSAETVIPPGGLVAFAGRTGDYPFSEKAKVEDTEAQPIFFKVEAWRGTTKDNKGTQLTFGELYPFATSN